MNEMKPCDWLVAPYHYYHSTPDQYVVLWTHPTPHPKRRHDLVRRFRKQRVPDNIALESDFLIVLLFFEVFLVIFQVDHRLARSDG